MLQVYNAQDIALYYPKIEQQNTFNSTLPSNNSPCRVQDEIKLLVDEKQR